MGWGRRVRRGEMSSARRCDGAAEAGPGERPRGPHSDGDGDMPGAGGTYFEEVAIGAITPNPRQPRHSFDEDTLEELALSIREVGLLQPVVVRRVMPGRYELIMGERRWRACQRAGLEHIPAIVRGTTDDEMLREALMENLHREQLNPLDEGAAYQQLLDDFGATHAPCSHSMTPAPRTAWRTGSCPKDSRYARWRRSSPWAATSPPRPAAP